MESAERIAVEVAYAGPGGGVLVALEVPARTTALDAVRRSGILQRIPPVDIEGDGLGVFGRRVRLDAPLRAGDRVEIYRPLVVDPKEARRRRARSRRRAAAAQVAGSADPPVAGASAGGSEAGS